MKFWRSKKIVFGVLAVRVIHNFAIDNNFVFVNINIVNPPRACLGRCGVFIL